MEYITTPATGTNRTYRYRDGELIVDPFPCPHEGMVIDRVAETYVVYCRNCGRLWQNVPVQKCELER